MYLFTTHYCHNSFWSFSQQIQTFAINLQIIYITTTTATVLLIIIIITIIIIIINKFNMINYYPVYYCSS